MPPDISDPNAAKIMDLLKAIQRDTSQCVTAIHGGKDDDGAHITGLVTRFDGLEGRVLAVESRGVANTQRWWAMATAGLIFAIGKAVDWLSAHIK